MVKVQIIEDEMELSKESKKEIVESRKEAKMGKVHR